MTNRLDRLRAAGWWSEASTRRPPQLPHRPHRTGRQVIDTELTEHVANAIRLLTSHLTAYLSNLHHGPAGRNGSISRKNIRSRTVLTEMGPVEIDALCDWERHQSW
jgi:hypothetical protein